MGAWSSSKIRNKECVCRHCTTLFQAADVKARKCDDCLQLVSIPCACACGIVLQQPKWKTIKPCYAQGHSTRGKSYAEIYGSSPTLCGFQSGAANIAKQPHVRQKIREAMLETHPAHNPLFQHIWAEQALYMRGRTTKISKLEHAVAPFLRSWTQQYIVAGFKLDFAQPDLKRALEVNGCWFHACTVCNIPALAPRQKATLANDLKKQKTLEAMGWHIDVIWEHTLKQELFPL